MPAAVVVGRSTETEVATKFLNRIHTGSGVLVLSGEPGIGKTTLWSAVVERAQSLPARVLTARPARAEARLGFAALADLLAGVGDDMLGELPSPQRRALAVALLREDPIGRPKDHRAVSAATLSVFAALSRSGPLVVAIDDLQWLDRPSARVLDFVARRLADLPVRVIACRRVDGRDTVPPTLERAIPETRITRVNLGPLSGPALSRIIEDRLGRRFPPRTLARLLAVAGGNPLYAVGLARSLPVGCTSATAALPVPPDLHDLVDARIAALPTRTRAALLVVSALPSPTVELVASGMGASAGSALRALEPAEHAEVVALDRDLARVSFVHPLFAAGVYDAAAPADRRRVHRRLAESTSDIEEQARHLALGTAGVDTGAALRLEAAADHARSRGSSEIARDLAEHALRLTPTSPTSDVLRRTIVLAEHRFHAGEVGPARAMLEDVLTRATAADVRATALRVLGELRYHQDGFAEAVDIVADALTRGGDEPGFASQIQLRLSFAAIAAGDFAGAQAHGRKALQLVDHIGDDSLVAQALAVATMVDFLVGEGLDEGRLRRALQLEDPSHQMVIALRPSLIAGCLCLCRGKVDESVRTLQQVRAGVLARGDDGALPLVASCLAWAECWHGRLDAATRYAQEALDTALRLQSVSAECVALAYGAVASAYRGDVDSARLRANRALLLADQSELGSRTAALWARWALGVVGLAVGDPVAVDAALGPITAQVEREGLPEPVRGMFVPDEIEALVALQQLDRAERLIDILEESGTRHGRAWAIVGARRGRALVCAARGDLDAAAKSAASALEWCDGLELPLEVARTLLVAGQIERRRKRKRHARDLLGQAVRLFAGAGAALMAEHARVELERARAHHAHGLPSATERLVADLSASGLTNREVAIRLRISPKTVESNLSRIYRKLDIHSRAELGARLSRGGATPRE